MRIRRKRPFDLSVEDYHAMTPEGQREVVEAYLAHLEATGELEVVGFTPEGRKQYRPTGGKA